ncbi:hypothetical protein Mic7113_4689 [Allocoleopsis franciscana PCC 7113]|uniref:Uncharacterized protein n=1 Tax=Allocoleopsis franciscana PCC 7113 TaxID=1173027 RepID=K9WLE3_9CYAN|nr:hypothetical protein Mic7113_4689 [Allocoleopsis franciscana PCC 7113]
MIALFLRSFLIVSDLKSYVSQDLRRFNFLSNASTLLPAWHSAQTKTMLLLF